MERIILPTVRAMARDGRPFKGVLFAGLMLTAEGPKLLEYNVRFGDPECQALMMRLKSDLLPALIAARDGILDDVDLRWYDDAALCVVMAAKGYPDDPLRGSEIRGLAAAATRPGRSRSSTPAPGATATVCSPMAAASSASPRSARPSPPPAALPIARSTRSSGPEVSAAVTSEGAVPADRSQRSAGEHPRGQAPAVAAHQVCASG